MDRSLRCRCGGIQGRLESPEDARRALCYCKDCQAYAQWLGEPERTLDAQGGTEIVAALPHRVHFDQGVERLRCMSLTPNGPLRWYAGCCRTAIGNTSRQPGLPYVGLVAACMPSSAAERDRSFGPIRIALNTASARGPVGATRFAVLTGVMRLMRKALGARLSGAYRRNPFFRAGSTKPLSEPETVSADERLRLMPGSTAR